MKLLKAVLRAAGEERCANPKCNAPLPAVEVWPGHIYIYCDKPECQQVARECPTRRYVGPNEMKCSVRDCDQFAPAGSYDKRHKWWVCSKECWQERMSSGRDTLRTCACGCGTVYYGSSSTQNSENYFFDRKHHGRFKTEKIMTRFGKFRPLFEEYLGGWAKRNYTGKQGVQPQRLAFSVFCKFLNERGITDIADVDAKLIDDFLSWGEQKGIKQVAYSPSILSTFFNWMKKTGRWKKDNPVLPGFHKSKSSPSQPKPYEDDQVDLSWDLLDERGNARTKLEMAIFEETGVRIGELANIRIPDVNQVKQRIFIRLPTKNGRTRVVPYAEKTAKYLAEWLEVRNPDCGHDHLLHNVSGKPCTEQQIRLELQKTLCKVAPEGYAREDFEEGFDRWTPHRMRHTAASRLAAGGADASTIMAFGGWRSSAAMSGYTEVNHDASQKGYTEAMARSEQQRRSPKPRRMSMADYMKRKKQA